MHRLSPPRLTFLFLKTFSFTGGIEKVNRTLSLALYELQQSGYLKIRGLSPYDSGADSRYLPEQLLQGYQGRRWHFMFDLLWRPFPTDILLVGHINLAPAVWLLQWRYPKLKIVLMAHGFEVWSPLRGWKGWLLRNSDLVFSVSRYTRDRMIEIGVHPECIHLLPNCLDPYFEPPQDLTKPAYLLERYNLRPEQKVLLTIARLSAEDGYKGYDRVLDCLPVLIQEFPDLYYIIAGKYDAVEKERLDAIVGRLQISNYVLFTGFVPDAEVLDHYRLADIFVMPSKKEGFGLVFIEAMACGTPAIGGDQDGSPDALCPGELGFVVNPDDQEAMLVTIMKVLHDAPDARELQRKTLEKFSYSPYRERLAKALQLSDANASAVPASTNQLQPHV